MSEDRPFGGLIRGQVLRAVPRVLPDTMAGHEDLKRRRAAVQRALTQELDRMLAPLGYIREADSWRKESALGRSALQFQKSTQGFDAYLNAGAGPRWPGRDLRFHRLGRFCPEMGAEAPDALPYLRLDQDQPFRDAVLTVVERRMIPWMEMWHRVPGLLRQPSPDAVRAVKLFEDE